MRDKDQTLLENLYVTCENTQQAKQLVQTGKLSQEDFQAIRNIDPTKTNKFVGWMSKQWVLGNINDINVLRNTIEEFNSFLDRRKTKHQDIYQYKTFDDIKQEVNELNSTGQDQSIRDRERMYEVVVDNNDLLICIPFTHEASRKLGLTHFAHRECEDGRKDSAWCTTYKTPDHFNDYYLRNRVTFWYVKVRSEEMQKQLKVAGFGPAYYVTAICIYPPDQYGNLGHEGYDGEDKKFDGNTLTRYLKILGAEIE